MGLSYIDTSAGPRMGGWADTIKSYAVGAAKAGAKAAAGAAVSRAVGGQATGGSGGGVSLPLAVRAAQQTGSVAALPQPKSKLKPILIGLGGLGVIIYLVRRRKRS